MLSELFGRGNRVDSVGELGVQTPEICPMAEGGIENASVLMLPNPRNWEDLPVALARASIHGQGVGEEEILVFCTIVSAKMQEFLHRDFPRVGQALKCWMLWVRELEVEGGL